MEQVAGGVDQSDRFFSRQNDRQSARCPGIRYLFDRVRSLQRLAEEETQSRRVQSDRADAQLPLLEQVYLIGADLFFAQLDPADDGNVERNPPRLSGKCLR